MAWSSDQYLKFEDERTRPARDLLAQVPLQEAQLAYDLGCGPGNSTELLAKRFGTDRVEGIDSDAVMLAAARKRLPWCRFIEADLGAWLPPRSADLLFANAVFQWLPNHLECLDRLMGELVPGGALAVQMPDNLDQPSHLLMEETAQGGPWRAAFQQSVRRAPLPSAEVYYRRLKPKSARVDIWRTTYCHPMPGPDAIVEWVKGTGLRPYLDRTPEEHRPAFLADYAARIAKAYPVASDGQSLMPFPRLFFVAIRV